MAAVLTTACTKDIEYKGPDSERMLIVNSITGSGDVPVLSMHPIPITAPLRHRTPFRMRRI